MRCLAIFLFAAACTTDTDTGQLTGFQDVFLAECQDAASSPEFSCGVRVAVNDGQVTALRVFNDGTLGAPSAVATLSENSQLEIADLIAQIPTSTQAVVTEAGCGGAPMRATDVDVAFDHDGPRHFQIHVSDGPIGELKGYVIALVKEIRTCSGAHLAFEQCAVNAR